MVFHWVGIAQLLCMGPAIVCGAAHIQPSLEPISGRDFSKELTLVLTLLPPTLSDRVQTKVVSAACIHCTYLGDPDTHVQDGECQNEKDTPHASSMKTECDYQYGGIKTVACKNLIKTMVKPRDLVRKAEEKVSPHTQLCSHAV